MENILGFLLLGVFYAFYILVSAMFIAFSVHSFKDEKYFRFGVYLMLALWYAISLIELEIMV